MIKTVIAYKGERNLPMGLDRLGRLQKTSDHRVQYIKVHEGRDISFYIAGLELAGVTFEYLPTDGEVMYAVTRLRGQGNLVYPVRPDRQFFQVYTPSLDTLVLETGTEKWAMAKFLCKRELYESTLPLGLRLQLEVQRLLEQHNKSFEAEEHY